MRKFGDKNLVPLDLELEKALRRIRKYKRELTEVKKKSMENSKGFREEE